MPAALEVFKSNWQARDNWLSFRSTVVKLSPVQEVEQHLGMNRDSLRNMVETLGNGPRFEAPTSKLLMVSPLKPTRTLICGRVLWWNIRQNSNNVCEWIR